MNKMMSKTYSYVYWKYFGDGGWYISADNSDSSYRGWCHLFDGIMEHRTPVSVVSFFKETGIKPTHPGQVVVDIVTVDHANPTSETVVDTEYCSQSQLEVREGQLRDVGYTRVD